MRKFGWNKVLLLGILLQFNFIGYTQTYQVNGDAVDFGNGLVRLTSSTPAKGAGVWQTASAWSTTQHDLTKPFDMTFNLFFGCESGPNGGDGITFTFQNKGLNALGAGGGFLGIGGNASESIIPAISIEFDTYDASAFGATNEIPDDHIAVDINGDVNGTTNTFQGINGVTTVQPVNNGRDLESCAQNANDYYTIRIVWDPSAHTLQLYEEGVLTMTYTNDLVTNLFGGNSNVYWGFTAATGSASNEQWIAPEGTLIPWQCTSTTSCCVPFTITPTGPSTVCNNPITIGVSGTYTSYKWSTGETTSTIDVSAPGDYVVTVTQDQSGTMCPGIDTITIVPTGPTAVLSGGATLCNDGSTTPLSVALNGTPPWSLTYAIDGVDQPVVTGINSSPYTFQGSASHTYTLSSVVDNGGCPGVVSGSAIVNSYPGLPVGHDTTFLAPGPANLKVNDEGGIYKWYDASTGGSLVSTGANFTTPTLPGTTTYYVENASIPAFTTKSVALLNQAEGDGPAPNDMNTGGLPRDVLFLNFTANKNFTFDTVTCAINVVGPTSGTSKVSVTIQDITAGTSVTKDSLLSVDLNQVIQNFYMPLHYDCIAGHDYKINYEGDISSGGLGGNIKGIMYWQLVNSYPITTDPEVTITGSGVPATSYPGLFDWKISYGNVASACGRTAVTAYPCPTGVLSGDASICDANSTTTLAVDFTGVSPWTMIYSIDGVAQNPVTGITQDPYQFQSAAGAHVYTLTSVSNSNSNGCTGNASGTATVKIYTFPNGHDATFISPGTATLSVDDNTGTYDWYDAATGGNLVFTGTSFTTPVLTDTTTYYIEDKNASVNCGRIPVTAFPVKATDALFIPNLITPNNDGKNDIFEIKGLPPQSRLKVVNRWGESIYSSDNYNNLWKATEVIEGVYYYDLILPNGKNHKGWLSIVR